MLKITEESFLKELSENDISIDEINILLVNKLTEKCLKIATAESCTGGLISKKITEIPGASAVFDCGICSYSNEIKYKILGVDENVLNTLGAVSSETAIQMAQGVRQLADSYIGVSTTGIAGPAGGTAEKPVGLVYIGVSMPGKAYSIKALFAENKINNREKIRNLAAAYAMYIVYKEIKNTI